MTTTAIEPRAQELSARRELVEDDVIDLRFYVKIVRKHRWPIIAATALLTGIAAFVVSGMTPMYRATSTLLIETQQTMPMNLDEIIGIDTTNREYYQTQFEVLKSKKLARRVVEEMGLYNHPELSQQEDKETTLYSFASAQVPTVESAETSTLDAYPIEHQLVVERFIKRLSLIHI